MDYKTLASEIPAEYRREILKTNMINHAQSSLSNPGMMYLFNIYKTYVDPDRALDPTCGSCLHEILQNWKILQPVLVSLEKESQLLKSLK